MHESALATEEWVPCDPVLLETDDGFVLSDQAQAILAAMDAIEGGYTGSSDLDETPLSTLDEIAVLRAQVDKLAACDQAVIAEIERRPDTIERTGARSTAAWLAQALRIRPAEAKRRVRTANGCAPRMSLTGEPLPPTRPHVAAAQAAGVITADHAHTIDRAVDAMPTGLPVEVVDAVERELLAVAHKHDASDVARLGRDIRDTLDTTEPKARDETRRRRRDLRLTQHDDGSCAVSGDLTAGLFAKLQTVLSPLAAPRPDDGNGPDTRAADVRLHDALEDLCDRFLASGTLPDSGGVPTTLIVTMTVNDLERRTGRTKRLATPGQTKALIARDQHCSFPGCTIRPQWCQRHHVLDWLFDGETEVDNLTLLCGHHHRNFERWGWTCTIEDGVVRQMKPPCRTPPPDLDPTRTPLRNESVCA